LVAAGGRPSRLGHTVSLGRGQGKVREQARPAGDRLRGEESLACIGACTRPAAEDHLANLRAAREGTRVFSAYELRDGTRIWIITEADRSVTTILLPEEYG
jgi:hypothetical protein